MDDFVNFMKPRCPVEIGDRFWRANNINGPLNPLVVTDIQETRDEDGTYYIVTGKQMNTAIGQGIFKYDSRFISNPDNVVIQKRKSDGKRSA